MGNQAAFNLKRLREQIEKELRKSKSNEYFSSSQVKQELDKVSNRKSPIKAQPPLRRNEGRANPY